MILGMKITKFEIQLDNQQPAYYAGQTIAGQVHLELAAELDFRSITLALHGDANVSAYFLGFPPNKSLGIKLRSDSLYLNNILSSVQNLGTVKILYNLYCYR